ncbi:hypothetical protein ACIQF6_31625 [Kitasatospora sp. NPDC092948]|uniref:hypothetical protein n=1 Tax=Kitasatospora sp. NPDC092948 TaxID=3364088 RepID=UPI00382FE30B
MADTPSDGVATRWSTVFGGCALRRHPLLLSLIGAACVVLGILVAVLVPEGDGPAWVMAVAGCLATGVLLLVRVGLALLRPGSGTAS